jgi:hypothetical protein
MSPAGPGVFVTGSTGLPTGGVLTAGFAN